MSSIRINAPPVRVHAGLVVYHCGLDPKNISERLGLEPSLAHKRGQILKPGRTPTKTGLWILESANHVHSDKPNLHLEWLLDQIANRHGVIRDLLQRDYKIEVRCRLSIKHWNTKFELEPHTTRRLANLNIPLSFDIYDDQYD